MLMCNICFQLASERCQKSFAQAEGDKDKELKMMLNWAFEGFLPTGSDGFAPPGMYRCFLEYFKT